MRAPAAGNALSGHWWPRRWPACRSCGPPASSELMVVSEPDERLDDIVELLVRDLERALHVIEIERVRRYQSRVDPLALKHPEQPLHAQPTVRAESGCDRLVRHADAPLDARYAHVITLAEVAGVGHRPAGLGDLDRGLEGRVGAQRLDRGIDALAVGQLHDAIDDILLGEVDDLVRAVDMGQLLPLRN